MFQPNPENEGASDFKPGITCPSCAFRIIVTMEMLLFEESINCNACGLVLNLNREEAGDVLRSVQQLYDGINEAERLKDQALEHDPSAKPRRTRRNSDRNN